MFILAWTNVIFEKSCHIFTYIYIYSTFCPYSGKRFRSSCILYPTITSIFAVSVENIIIIWHIFLYSVHILVCIMYICDVSPTHGVFIVNCMHTNFATAEIFTMQKRIYGMCHGEHFAPVFSHSFYLFLPVQCCGIPKSKCRVYCDVVAA